MRTMTSTYPDVPVTVIEIFNQAREGVESNVTIDGSVVTITE